MIPSGQKESCGFAYDLIGIQPHVEALERLLNLKSVEDGKTTLATVLYDRISHHYQFGACCFFENVSKIYRDGGAIAVQRQILHQTLKEPNLDAYSPSEISGIIINRIIITTRDMHILELYGADKIYEAELMNDNDAHDLFLRKAFKSDNSRSTILQS
ncbi:NB-ARC domain disease resistance protein [Medicago truncatula]|uniref:NB-ARC domain disease resistance protein n=1 Tax=Medicago truncatula TaxID=3880 RepID=A0A072U183_MEDTR|nr:NB-ARC domain disease resistance protein [Medicago truncatula]